VVDLVGDELGQAALVPFDKCWRRYN